MCAGLSSTDGSLQRSWTPIRYERAETPIWSWSTHRCGCGSTTGVNTGRSPTWLRYGHRPADEFTSGTPQGCNRCLAATPRRHAAGGPRPAPRQPPTVRGQRLRGCGPSGHSGRPRGRDSSDGSPATPSAGRPRFAYTSRNGTLDPNRWSPVHLKRATDTVEPLRSQAEFSAIASLTRPARLGHYFLGPHALAAFDTMSADPTGPRPAWIASTNRTSFSRRDAFIGHSQITAPQAVIDVAPGADPPRPVRRHPRPTPIPTGGQPASPRPRRWVNTTACQCVERVGAFGSKVLFVCF